MADKRKLNSDIDRTLKRVQEGRTAFQEILDKYDSSTNQTQKEKYESDLKKEIKKLQRLRDQIKTWLTSNDIKDKKGLLEARKFIESDMERFKVIEKETKTKAYSKEGLLSGGELKKDPYAKERIELDEWLKQSIATLKSSSEKYEFEIESLSSSCKKKRIDKEKQTAIEDKKNRLEMCNFHIEKLETTMRLLDNEKISVEKIKQVKSGVDYVIETLDEPSLIDDKTLYDDLSLDELSDLPSGITGASSQNENDGIPLSSTSSRIATGGDSSDYSTDGHCSSKSTEDGKFDFSLPHQMNSASSTSTPIKNTTNNISVTTKTSSSKSCRELVNHTAPPHLLNSSSQNKNTKSSSDQDNTKSDGNIKKKENNTELSNNISSNLDIHQPITVDVSDQKKNFRKSPLNTPTAIPSVTTPRLNNSISQSSSIDPSNLTQMHPKEAAAPFRNKQLDISKASSFPVEMQSQLQKLDCAFHRLPNPCDTEKARMIVCKNLTSIPPYYPKEPQKNTDTEEYFMKLDPNTLFFIFYYFEGTKAQYLAAKSLKKMSWRFHTKLMMWFQRHEEPKQITDEFESGTYIYYDYKTMTQRRKEDFIFHYIYLEDKDF